MEHLKPFGWDDGFAVHLSPEDIQNFVVARVTAEHKNAFAVVDGASERRATISGKFFHDIRRSTDMPVVGDWVCLRRDIADAGVIEKIIPRKTMLSRRAPNDRKTFGNDKEQVIVANVDVVFIVSSLNQNFNLSRIERALALVYTSGAMPVILLSKADLADDAPAKIIAVEGIAFGVPIISFSNITGQNIDQIRSYITPGKTVSLIGSSGVGKTSLLNILTGRDEKTIEIRATDDRGRHATTARSLYVLDNGGMIIDTPGIREMGLVDGTDDLDEMYGDIEELAHACRYTDCSHTNEPGCALLSAIENGTLDERRLKNYFRLQKEQRFIEDKDGARRAKQAWHKSLAKEIRQMKKKGQVKST